MPKKPFFESAIHHLLLQAKEIADHQRVMNPEFYREWKEFVNSFFFTYVDNQTIRVDWKYPKKGKYTFSIAKVKYYTRGDNHTAIKEQRSKKLIFTDDKIYQHNVLYFKRIVKIIAKQAGIHIYTSRHISDHQKAKMHEEEELSDQWALSVNPEQIDVVQTNTSLTSPELRYIHTALGNVTNKKILDLGSGLGEVSVFFAINGAKITAVDVSLPMLSVTQALAKKYGVKVSTVQASIEHLSDKVHQKFDIVYVGNVFHHVDIPKALAEIKKVLKPEGVLILWEPVGYNPIINVYRRIAHKVRSHDERPFVMSDVSYFTTHFESVSVQWFWLTTLLIFLVMYLQGRDPNKERYWKSVIKEEKIWSSLYRPLEAVDAKLLRLFPFLGPLCWNVCMICRRPLKVQLDT